MQLTEAIRTITKLKKNPAAVISANEDWLQLYNSDVGRRWLRMPMFEAMKICLLDC
jgi:hypothetical protein